MRALNSSLHFVVNHPLNRNHPVEALKRWLKWQIGSRLVPGPVAVHFVNDVQILVSPGMTGATGNVYAGLHEFEDMAFVLHSLRPGDLFVDVGANVGSYTLLAGGGAKASCISIEPLPSTFAHLARNVALNDLGCRVALKNLAVGSEEGVVRFTSRLDTENHVVSAEDMDSEFQEVSVATLDGILSGQAPRVIKVDVEGFEMNVINGGEATLSAATLDAVLMELNGLGARYGFDEREIHRSMLEFGFMPYSYLPAKRKLAPEKGPRELGNTLYIKNLDAVAERVMTAPSFTVLNQQI